jgi:cysteine-rich repeat protein
VDAGEACDDGNNNDSDACPNRCLFYDCGDGIVGAGEACDDGNTNNTDACRNNCTLPRCGDGIVDEGEDCDDGNGVAGDGCENDCTLTQSEAICRSPGFWGTHAGVEKTRSKNITEAVIDCADGNCADHTANDYLLICGEKIDSPDSNPADGTTDWNDAASSTEALCVPVKGAQILQLARQLTAAALNCILSNGDETCASTPLYATAFANCNTTCAASTTTKEELTACIGELDCLNNGRTFINGLCLDPAPGSCSERQLVNVALGLDFEPPGPAGSPDACHAAHATKCNVVGAAEGPPHDGAHCGTDSLP